VLTRDPTDKELLAGIARPKSHFGKTCPPMNSKFSRPPGNADDAHVRADSAALDDILCLEYGRKVGNDYIVRLIFD
jgi:hypothetical protein